MKALGVWTLIFTVAAAPASPPGSLNSRQIFRTDDPIWTDRDSLPIPMPHSRDLSEGYDFLENTFFGAGDDTPQRALNINTVGEVPDSSWYTNRLSIRDLTTEELVRGANTGDGPVPGHWTVVDLKTGRMPGFLMKDSRGDGYFVKFDPVSNPEMATAAEMISSRFFHALGYHVAEYYLVDVDPSKLILSEGVPFTRDKMDAMLEGRKRNVDGTIRALASKMLPGENMGPFKFHGTRPDDPNDIYPHEHRRELRGYYVAASWLNHDDSRAVNTLDMYVGKEPKGYVKHHLIDFGSTLGSGSLNAQKRQGGNEYWVEFKPTLASILSLGMWTRPWVMVEYPDFRSIGRFEAEFFRPEKWKPEYPNAAFRNMDPEDALWAVRQILKFSDKDIRAVVRTGKLSDPEAEHYLAQVLMKRRDKIADYWLRQISPLDGFRIENGSLVFEDLRGTHAPQTVRFESFDNRTGERKSLGSEVVTSEPRVKLPSTTGSFFVVRLSEGQHFTDVFLRRSESGLSVVGIQRK